MPESIWSFSTETSGAIKSLADLEKRLNPIDNITKSMLKAGGVSKAVFGDTKSASASLKIVQSLNAELDTQKKALAGIEAQQRSTSDLAKYRTLTSEAERYRQKIADIADEIDSVSGKTDSYSKFRSSALQPVSTAAQALGSVTTSQAATDVSYGLQSATQIGRTFGQLKDELVELGPTVKDGVAGFKNIITTMGSVAQGTTSLSTGLGAVTAALSPIAVVAAAVVIGMLAIGKVLDAISQDADRAAQSANNYVDALDREIATRQQLNQLKTSTDPKAVTQALTEADQAQADALEKVQGLQRKIYLNGEAYARLGASFNPGERNRLGAYGKELQDDLDAANKALLATSDTYNELLASAPDVQTSIEGNQAAERLTQAESDLKDIRLQAKSAADQLAKQVQEFDEQSAYEALKSRRERQRADALAEDQHDREIGKIILDGQKSIEGIYKDSAKTIATDLRDFGRAEVAAYKQLGKALTQVDLDYNKNEVKLETQHNKDKLKSDAAYAKEELRRRQDLNDSLLDAELSNDSIAYLRLQRDAKKENLRQAEDRQQQLDDDQEAYQQQQDDLKTSRDEQRQQLLDSYRDEKQDRLEALQLQISDEREALAERLAEQRTNNAQALQEAQDAFDLQQQLQTQQRQWQDQDQQEANARQLDQMRKSFDDQQSELQKHDDELMGIIRSGGKDQLKEVNYGQLQIVSAYAAGADRAVAVVREKMASLSYGDGSGNNYIGSYSNGLYNKNNPFGNLGALSGYTGGGGGGAMFAAEGAVITKPTLTLLGERETEFVIPMSKAPGLPGGLGTQVHFDFSGMSIGSGISEQVFQQQMGLFGQTIVKALKDARGGKPF